MSTAIIVNLKVGEITNKYTTNRTNFPFNSFCKMADGTYIGASDTLGLCTIGGTTDNGAAISAYFEPVQTDLGMSNVKRMRFIYLTFEAPIGAQLQIIATPDEKASEAVTVTFTAVKSGKQTIREAITRASSGTYWSFLVKNVAGNDYSISRLEVLPIVLSVGRRP